MKPTSVVVKEDVVELHTKHGVLSTDRRKDELYTPEQIAEVQGLNPSLTHHALKSAGAIRADGLVEGHWRAIIYHLLDRETLSSWAAFTPRDRAYKYMKQLCQLRHSSDGNALYGDYRVHELFADIVDLLGFVLQSESFTRIKSTPQEIYDAIHAKGNELYDEDAGDYAPFDWGSLEGNIEDEEAIDLYTKLSHFRVFDQGRQVRMDRTRSLIMDMVADDYPANSVKFEAVHNTPGILSLEILGPNSGKLACEIRDSYSCRMVAAPYLNDNSPRYYLIF